MFDKSAHPPHRQILVHGNSMDRAGLCDGMVVWVRITKAAKHRDIVVVRQADDSLIVKRLFRSRRAGNQGGAWLVPESTERRWKPRPMGEGDAIVGVVVRVEGLT